MAPLRSHWSSLFLLVSLLGIIAPNVQAQSTTAVCAPGYEWMFNSRGQNPCLIAAYLNSPCVNNPASSSVDALPSGFHYAPPTLGSATICQCNTVLFSLIQACATCQNDPIVPWSTWNTNCTSAIFQSVYPRSIPPGTAVPAWAYLNVTTSDNFNATDAHAYANTLPKESVGSDSSATSSSGAPVTTTGTSVPNSSHSKSNTGAIVGGVVGGVGGSAILAGLLFFLWRRYQAKAASNARLLSDSSPQMPTPAPNVTIVSHSPPMSYVTSTEAGFQSSGRLYDPNDPTTFPPPNPGTIQAYRNAAPHFNGQYSGAPEF